MITTTKILVVLGVFTAAIGVITLLAMYCTYMIQKLIELRGQIRDYALFLNDRDHYLKADAEVQSLLVQLRRKWHLSESVKSKMQS